MTAKVREQIDELKEIVLALHRSAGQLDDIIQGVELGMDEDEEYFKIFVRSQALYRKDYKHNKFDDLEKRETDAWKKLKNSFGDEP